MPLSQSRTVLGLSVHMPFRLIMAGKTGDSESTTLARMLLDKHFYRDDFQPENIFTFVGIKRNAKLNIMKRELDIPDHDVVDGHNQTLVEVMSVQ